MYFPIGWPKYLELQNCRSSPISVFCNRDRSLFGVLTNDSISIWYIRPCVEVTCFKRSKESIDAFGINQLAEWKPDSLMIVITTSLNHLLFFQVEVDDSVKYLYEQLDSKISGLRRESDELYLKEKVPPISLEHIHTLCLSSKISSLVCIRDELMVTTVDGSTFHEVNLFVKSMEYSPIIGGFSVVLSNGQACFITASTLKFEPHQVFGIFAQDVQNALCTAVNHRYRLIAYGLKNKDFPDIETAAGGSWLGLRISRCYENALRISSIEWGPEGYHLWTVVEKPSIKVVNQAFCVNIKVALFQFAKSALTVNAGMTGREHVFLQAEDRLYISAGADIIHNKPINSERDNESEINASS
ncbi:guanine nucleotide exchange factor subunit R06F6.8 [Caerostris extrusa]|uniref:Guanine nucleotide exchange factor subunit R06F6.8 n=1 Tax=Caerostris extrusa TaxID=172846 RepID=A0AAV4MM27_CAEEX|nr:guanine nucleotide exchange factor subunit R06F6.8 [Caerostris extrusa]